MVQDVQSHRPSQLARCIVSGLLPLRGVQQGWPPLGHVRDRRGCVEVQRFLGAFFTDRHLALRAARDVDRMRGYNARTVDVGHGMLRSQLGFLVAVLVVGHVGLEAAKATAFGREATRLTLYSFDR